MVVLDPDRVELGGAALSGVKMITLDRNAERLLEEWEDGGRFCAFVDVSRERVTAKVKRLVGAGERAPAPALGSEVTLVFVTSGDRSGAGGAKVTVAGVVVGVTHESPAGAHAVGRTPGAVQTIELRAIGANSAADPVTVEADGGV